VIVPVAAVDAVDGEQRNRKQEAHESEAHGRWAHRTSPSFPKKYRPIAE